MQNDGQYVQSLTLKSAEGEFLCALHFHLSVRPVPMSGILCCIEISRGPKFNLHKSDVET